MARSVEVTRRQDGAFIAQVTYISEPAEYSEDAVVNAIGFLNQRMAEIEGQKLAQVAALDAEITKFREEKAMFVEILAKIQAAEANQAPIDEASL